FTHYTDLDSVISMFIWSLFTDREGNVWMGAALKGVIKYDGKHFIHYTSNEGLDAVHVRGFGQDENGNIYTASMQYGVSRFDGEKFHPFLNTGNGLLSNDVRHILVDSKNRIWMGTAAGISVLDKNELTHYTTDNGPFFAAAQKIIEDKYGNIWFGSERNGLLKYDGTHFIHYDKDDGLTDTDIWSIMEDEVGNIWIGTNGGLNHIYNEGFYHFNQDNGLSGHVILTAF